MLQELSYAVVDSMLAGAFLLAAVVSGMIARHDRPHAVFIWFTLLAASQAIVMAAAALSITQPSAPYFDVALMIRDAAQGVTAALSVLALGSMVPGIRVRWIVVAVLAVAAARSSLWMHTNLILIHPVLENAWPEWGPLGSTAVVYAVGTMIAAVQAARHGGRHVRRMLIVTSPFAVVPAVAAAFVAGLGRQELIDLASAATGVAVLWTGGTRLALTARRWDDLARQQASLAAFARSAVESSGIESIRGDGEELLRHEIDDASVVIEVIDAVTDMPVSGWDAPADQWPMLAHGRRHAVTASGTGPVRKRHRAMIASVLQIIAASADRTQAELDLAHGATHDPMTGMPNQVLFLDRLRSRLVEDSSSTAVLVCRVHGLDRIVGTQGHVARDSAIRAVAGQLENVLPRSAFLAQVSSGSFAAAVTTTPGEPRRSLHDRTRSLRDEVAAGLQQTVELRIEFGAAAARPDSSAEELLRDATTALGQAREADDAVAVFDPELRARVRGRAELEGALRGAIARGEIEVHYQPIVDSRTGRVTSYEALARWRRAMGFVPPLQWIPLAEGNGLIHELGRHVLATASRDQAVLQTPVSVNVSVKQLTRRDFVATVLDAIGSCPPDRIVLEVTESAVTADLAQTSRALRQLRSLGMKVALDDFGTSYSSLSVLSELPIDILKIDKSFVDNSGTPAGVSVINAIVTLAAALGKSTVAEGVETGEQLQTMIALGITNIQGFLFGRPMPAPLRRPGHPVARPNVFSPVPS